MKTIMDYPNFRPALKVRCREFGIIWFYYKSVIANWFSFIRNPIVFISGDPGDEVYDAVHFALGECGLKVLTHYDISPYDVVEMKGVYGNVKDSAGRKHRKWLGMTVEWKKVAEIRKKFGRYL